MLGIKPLDPQGAFVGGDVSEMHVVIRVPWDDEKQRLAELLTLCQYFLKQCYLHAHAPLGFGGYKHNNVDLGTYSYMYTYTIKSYITSDINIYMLVYP
jgi:hypothetical protein